MNTVFPFVFQAVLREYGEIIAVPPRSRWGTGGDLSKNRSVWYTGRMVHLYYGEGKGKTTAALGMAARAAGNGWRVVFVQFLKGRRTGELAALARLGAVVLRGKAGGRFAAQMTAAEREETRAIGDANFARARELCSGSPAPVLLVLDEICAACALALVDAAAVDAFLAAVPDGVEVVLTGREPPARFIERADYVTEMRCVRHPFAAGVAARAGVEF